MFFSVLENHLPDAHAFADDTQFYVSFKPDGDTNESTAVTAMQNCIDDVKNWMLNDKLKLNDDKTEFLLIGTQQQLAKVNLDTLRVGNVHITQSCEVKSLGCWFDSQMKLETHITKTCKAAFFHIYNIRRIRKFLSEDNARTLVNAFVTSRLDYCNSLLYGLPATSLNQLQRVQNTAARLICNTPRFDHITPSLFKLHWLPIKFRINFKILLIAYKAIHGLAPEYISDIITVKPKSNYSLRPNSQLLLQKPKMKSLATLDDRSFAFAAPTLWNKLPEAIRHAGSVSSFKRRLKTYLFREAFY